MTTEKAPKEQQKRLTTAILILVGVFALRFGLLLFNAQKNLDYASKQERSDEVVSKPRVQSGFVQSGTDTTTTGVESR